MADEIVLNIVLSGNEEIANAFERIKSGGVQALGALGQTASASNASLTALGTTLTVVAAGMAAVTAGAFAFVSSMTEAVDTVGDLATQIGVTTEEVSGLKAAFADSGVAPQQLEQSFRRLSQNIAQSWSNIKKELRDGADQAVSNSASIVAANQRLTESLREVAKQDRDFTDQRRQNALGLVEAEQRLISSRLSEARLAGVDTTAAEQLLQRQQARLSTMRAQTEVQQAQRRIAEQAQAEEDRRVKDAVQARQAELALRQAERKEDDDRKNSVANAIDAVRKLGEGNKEALKDINATPENLAKGIIGAAKLSEDAIKKFQGNINEVAGAGPGVVQTFKTLGEALTKIEDPALRDATAARLLGRAVSQDLLQVFSNPGKIEEFTQRLKDLGLATTSLDTSAANDFRSALFTLQNDVGQVGQKIATALAPAFTHVLENIDEFVVGSKDKMVEWATDVGRSVEKYLEALDRVSEGRATPDDQWLIDLIKSFDDLVSSAERVRTLFSDLVVDFQKYNESLKELTGFDFSGLFSPLETFRSTLREIAVIINAVVDAWNLFNKAMGGTVNDSALQGAKDRMKAIKDLFFGNAEERKKAIEDYAKANEDQNKRDQATADTKKKAGDSQKQTTKDIAEGERTAAQAAEEGSRRRVKGAQDVLAAEREVTNERKKQTEIDSGSERERTERLKREVRERAAEERRVAQVQNPNDFIDRNGIRNIVPESSLGSGTGSSLNDLLQAAARSLGLPLSQIAGSLSPEGRFIGQNREFGGSLFPGLGGVGNPFAAPFEFLRDHTIDPQRRLAELNDPRELAREARGRFPSDNLGAENTVGEVERVMRDFVQTLENLISETKTKQEAEQAAQTPQQESVPPAGSEQQLADLPSLLSELGGAVQSAIDQLKPIAEGPPIGQETGLDELSSLAQSAADGLEQLAAAASDAAQAAAEAAAALSSVQGGGGGGTETTVFAAGGPIGGRPHSQGGTVIEAELGEFMHPVRAVQHYGLNFMEAVRTLRFPRFADGGLVMSPRLPRFADGGVIDAKTGGLPLGDFGTVKFDMGGGVEARAVINRGGVESLRKAATLQQLSSTTNRKSGFVR